MRICVERRCGEERHCTEADVGEIFGLLCRRGVGGVWVAGWLGLRVAVVRVGVCVGRRRCVESAAGEFGEIEVRDVEVAGVGFDGEVFVPFVLGRGVSDLSNMMGRRMRMHLPSLCRP